MDGLLLRGSHAINLLPMWRAFFSPLLPSWNLSQHEGSLSHYLRDLPRQIYNVHLNHGFSFFFLEENKSTILLVEKDDTFCLINEMNYVNENVNISASHSGSLHVEILLCVSPSEAKLSLDDHLSEFSVVILRHWARRPVLKALLYLRVEFCWNVTELTNATSLILHKPIGRLVWRANSRPVFTGANGRSGFAETLKRFTRNKGSLGPNNNELVL